MGGSTMQNRRTFIRNLGAGSLGVFVLSGPMQAFAKSDLIQLTILHTNDFHSHIDPFPKDAARNAGEGGNGQTRGHDSANQGRAKKCAGI